MKENFESFYRPTDVDFSKIWKNSVFILDTNVLLNLYRYPEEARDQTIEILRTIKNRLWIPHHAALEYHRNRLEVIVEQQGKFSKAREITTKLKTSANSEFDNLDLRRKHSLIEPDTFLNKIGEIVKEFHLHLDEKEKEQIQVSGVDFIRDSLDKLFSGKIGSPPDKGWIEGVSKKGEERYKYRIPPGYLDADKSKDRENLYSYNGIMYEKQYGDLIIWMQILDYCRERKCEYIIFITDDEKEDWWWVNPKQSKTKIGPRPELVNEITKETNVKGFTIYNSERFLTYSREHLNAKISDDSIEQIRAVRTERNKISREEFFERLHSSHSAVKYWLNDNFPEATISELDNVWADYSLSRKNSKGHIKVIYIEGLSVFEKIVTNQVKRAQEESNSDNIDFFALIYIFSNGIDKDSAISSVSKYDFSNFRSVILAYGYINEPMDGEGQPAFLEFN